MNNKPAPPKMSRKQAKIFWDALTPQQREDFKKMYAKMEKGELMLTNVMVDDNEQIQRIILEPKDKPSVSPDQFYKHFKE